MATLFGTKIKDTYEGVLKIIDNLGLTATNKDVTDGTGVVSGLKLGTGDTVEVTKRVSQTGLGFSTFFGEGAGLSDDGSNNFNASFGGDALKFNTTGSGNSAVGFNSLINNTSGNANTAIGSYSSQSDTTGISNTSVGFASLQNNAIGDSNTSIGTASGFNSNKSGCVFLGASAGYDNTLDNTLHIANSNTATPLIWGDFANSILTFNADTTATSIIIPLSSGEISNAGGYKDSTGALGTANQVLSTTGTVTTWIDAEVNTIESITIGEPTGSDQVVNVVSLTQAEYDAGTPIATTFYIIK